MSVSVVGISAYHGDSSAALVTDGRLVAAVEEERFTRIKHWAGFPRASIAQCLSAASMTAGDVQHFALARDPRAHLWRKAVFALRRRPGSGMMLDRLRNRRRVRDVGGAIGEAFGLHAAAVRDRTHWVEHHPAHLASAFFVSPFEEAAVCAIDGFGDFVSTSLAVGRGSRLRVIDRTFFPHSLGLFYLALTQFLGFRKYGDEYKVMGLAPYGKPDFVSALRQVVGPKAEYGFALDLSYFRHWSEGASMTWDGGEPVIDTVYTPKLEALLGPARHPEAPIEPRHEAIAASLQQVFEEVAFHLLNGLQRRTGLHRVCLAGGCAMNSVANGKIRERTRFREVYVQPAAADNGTALGAAYWVWHQVLGRPRAFVMDHAYWGPAFDADALQRAIAANERALATNACELKRFDDDLGLCARTAEEIAAGKIVGWFQGRMEWGARALGNRSILADPRRADMRDIINSKIKFREKFRPFAPSVLLEAVDEFFVGAIPDPFMIQVYPVRLEKQRVIPAVTHVDGSGRLQTVSRQTNRLYWDLLKAFGDLTGVPVLLNTSFNENEPIVQRPEEALDCFLRTRMDVLVLGPYFIKKAEAHT